MKRAYSKSQYAKPYERYCRELYPAEAEQIFQRAEDYYLEFMKDMPDLGENMMAKNMLDWLTIISFYEASGHRLDGKALLEIKRRAVEKMKFIGKLVDGNRSKWPYRLFEKAYTNFNRMQAEHQAKGEWLDSWKVEINPDRRTDGFISSAARSQSTPRRTATASCCPTSARPTTTLPRSCTRGSSARRPKPSVATAVITGTSATKAPCLRITGTWRRYEFRIFPHFSPYIAPQNATYAMAKLIKRLKI